MGNRTHINKTGTPGGTQTHESTDLQSAPLVALVPVHKLADSRGVEPHPISENRVFKARRRTNPAALLSIKLAGHERLELPRTVLETAMLPLHQ